MERKKAKRITPDHLHNVALWYLQRYAASSGRLRTVLCRRVERSCRDHPDQNKSELLTLIETELETLERVQLLNDTAYFDQLVDQYRARGLSRRMIENKLRLKGFDPKTVATLAPTNEREQEIEREAALRLLKKKRLPPFLIPDDKATATKARQKAWQTLARQGYDPDLIADIMKG